MYQKFGLTGIKYKYTDLVETALEVAESDLTEFFKKYVVRTKPLPIGNLSEIVGYGSAANVSILKEFLNSLLRGFLK